MKGKSKKNKRKSEMNAMFFIILLALVLFIISTYAWFTTQKNVSITNLKGTVQVAEGLEISLDAQNWSNGIVIGEGDGELDIIDDAYTGNSNYVPSELLPVSTLGLVTSNMTKINMLRGKVQNTTANSVELSEIQVMDESVADASKSNYAGYFSFDIFLKNSSKNKDADDQLQLNYDSALEVLEASNSITGLQNTARVAFAKYAGTSDVMADQTTVLKETAGIGVGASAQYISDIAIWEPNADAHAEYIVTNNNKITWSSTDATKYTGKDSEGQNLATGKFGTTTQMPTYALKESAIKLYDSSKGSDDANNKQATVINNIYKWDGSESTIQKQNTLQTSATTKRSTDTGYVLDSGVQQLVSASDGTTAFTIAPNKISRLKVYVWLEGQDIDCINYASYGGGIKVDIGLVKGSTIGSKGEAGSTDT